MIKNIVFDFGGVLLSGDDEIFFRNTEKLEKLLNCSRKELIKTWGKGWFKFRVGNITEEEFLQNYANLYYGNEYPKKEIIEVIKKLWREDAKSLPAFNFLKNLKTKYNLYALTNISKEWLEFKIEKFNLDNYFIKIFSSPEEKLAKPDVRIYKSILSKAGIKANESVFVDDLIKNVLAAKLVGFKTIHFKDKDQLEEELKNYGVNL